MSDGSAIREEPARALRDASEPRWKVYLGCFFTFAIMGLLLDICMVQRRPWYGVMIMSCMMGLISAGWAWSFNRHMKFLLFLIPASILVPVFVDFLIPSQAISVAIRRGLNYRLTVEVLICTAMFVVGYALTVSFIRGEGARHQRLRTEIALAQRIHDGLVRPIDRTTPQLAVFGRSDASSEMGGDLLDIDEAGSGLTLFVADVSGHGVAAGVLMGMVKSAIHMRLRSGAGLGQLVTDLNGVVAKLVRPGVFVTFACIRFGGAGRAEYALAGHLPILHFRAATKELVELGNESLPLGVSDEEVFEARSVETGAGDLFVLLTDGLMETMDADDRLFGEERIRRMVSENATRPLPEIYGTLMSAVRAHGPQADDQTVLLARVLA